MEWVFLPLKRYADFSGRSRRLEFWMFSLLNVIVYAVLMTLIFAGGMSLAAFSDPAAMQAGLGPIFWLGMGLLAIWALAIIIPSIAVTVRRLHDRDMSGWWYLGVIVGSMIPFVGILVSLGFLVLMFLPGTPGPNRFGPDPKDPASADVFA
jgi:uncharacterized membrane protein YhaH (DUF805 family)